MAGSLPALDPARSVFQYNCQNWTSQNGLPANGVNAITQTRDGYMWLGTQRGLVRWNGTDFKVLGLNQPQFQGQGIDSISSAGNGGLWFGIESGRFGYCDGQSTSFMTNVEWAASEMNAHVIREARDGSVWVGADSGLGRWVKGDAGGTFFDAKLAQITSVDEDSQGRVWLGSAEHGLYFWRAGVTTALPDESLKKTTVNAVVEDSNGLIWVGTSGGLRCYGTDFQPRLIPALENEIRALLVDRHGTLWIGTSGKGLARYENGAYTFFQKQNGLANDFVMALFEDREGSIWIGTQEGLSQLTDLKFPIFSVTEGLPPGSSHSVCASRDGGLWTGMSQGVCYFSAGGVTNYGTAAGISNLYVKRAFEAANGDVYLINGSKGIEVLSNGNVVARYSSQTWPVAMVEDTGGMVVSVGDSLFRLAKDGLAPFVFSGTNSPATRWIYNLALGRDGAILVACDNGVFRVKDGDFQRWSVSNGLSGVKANWVCEDSEGAMWAGLSTGIARIKKDQVRNIGRENGLSDNTVFAIVPDDWGYFWMSSPRGIFRASHQSLDDFADGKADHVNCEMYNGSMAMKTSERTDQEASGCKTRDGRIWFPSPQGIVMIDPANIFTNPVAPLVHIEQIRINGLDLKGRQIPELRPGRKDMEFHFGALSYIAPRRVQVRYQLEGYDPVWVEAADRRSVLYRDLKAGKYVFKVQACNADHVWNTTGDSFEVEFPPAFYQTTWFKALCGLLVVAALGGAYGWRIRRLKTSERKLQEANDLLEAKVRERTGELARANAAMEETHNQLVLASRRAGMAEVAAEVLHNVGNVLNSVNVSVEVLAEAVKNSKGANLAKVADMLLQHKEDPGQFLTQDEQGKHLPAYIGELGKRLDSERAKLLQELESLAGNIGHIKHIVSMQQTHARMFGVEETATFASMVEDAFKISEAAFQRHHIRLIRKFDAMPPILVDRHKVLQILVNLFQNAKRACAESGKKDCSVTARICRSAEDLVRIEIADNGIGIPPENLTRIFAHGFTTRKNGHGYGLHSGALAARDLGGTLLAQSDGPGQGATFILELPLCRNRKNGDQPMLEKTGHGFRSAPLVNGNAMESRGL